MNENARIYWRKQLSRVRVETEKLHDAIDQGERQRSFEIIQIMEGTLASLRASLRENMDPEVQKQAK
ncbi:MAG: hypothetical protein QG650_1025 [Patescibacteria group bacterium]|nr:hypothetical protein [Patescibacteria group bacterium]